MCFKLWYIAGQMLWKMTRGRKSKLWNPQKTRWIQWICISCMKDVRAQKVDLMIITVQLLLHQEESKFILPLFNFYITLFIRRNEGTDPDFAILYPVLRHWYLMMQNTYVRFPNWSKCRTVESDQSVQLGQFWRSLQLRNGKIRLSLKWFNFWTVDYCKGWRRADWHISECTFALWGKRGGGRGQSLQEKDMSCHFKRCSMTMDWWTM